MSSKILDDMRDVMRRRHYSIRTERSYCEWVKRFVLHFNMKSRDDLSEGEKKIYGTFVQNVHKIGCCFSLALFLMKQAPSVFPIARNLGIPASPFS
jgi:hypothetical protein